MKFSLKLGRYAGIPVSIHWSFFLLLGYVFYESYSGRKDINDGLWSVVFIMSLFLCVVLHEFGHALTARRFGIRTESITLLPIGGVANMERMPDKPREELLVALAGPAVNLAIVAIIFIFHFIILGKFPPFKFDQLYISSSNFLILFYSANLYLACFNLLPAFPMDGGRVLRAIISFFRDRASATRIAARIGQLVAIGFILFGIKNDMYTLALVGFFVLYAAGAESAVENTRNMLSRFTVRQVIMHNFTPLLPSFTIAQAVKILLDGQEKNFIIYEDNEVLGVVTRDNIIHGLSEYGNEAKLSTIMRKDFLSLRPELGLQDAYQEMNRKDLVICPVMQGKILLGVLDLENIKELLMVYGAMGE